MCFEFVRSATQFDIESIGIHYRAKRRQTSNKAGTQILKISIVSCTEMTLAALYGTNLKLLAFFVELLQN